MMNFGIPNTPVNRALASTVASRIGADTRMVAATAAFWRLLGLGGLLLLAGAGAGLACYGYAYATDPRATDNRLATALADALNKVTLKADGTLNLQSTPVKLDTAGATVRLDTQGGVVRLDSSGLGGLRPTPQQLGSDSRPASNARPVTNFTVFHNIPFAEGAVLTGWNYRNSEDLKPANQYCYYTYGSNLDDKMFMHYSIGEDGVMAQSGRGIPVNIEQAFANCVWFGSVHS